MKHSVPMGSRSGNGSSQSSGGESRPPLVDLTGGPLERDKKTPEKAIDLDKTIEMRDEMQAAMEVSEQETPRSREGPEGLVSDVSTSSKKKKKSKQTRRAK